MTRLFLSLLSLGIFTHLWAVGEVEWSAYLGGSGNEIPYDVTVDYSSGAYVVVGYTDSYDVDSGDIWILKVDASDGSVIWSRNYGGYAWDAAFGVAVDGQGYYAVVGYTRKPGVYPYDFDAWISRIDPATGDTVWNMVLDYSSMDMAYDVVVDGDGNYMVLGRSGTSFAVWKVNSSNGQLLWMGMYGTTADMYYGSGLPRAILSKDGGIVALGSTYNSTTRRDLALFAVDSSGNLLWMWNFDSGDEMDEIPGGIGYIGDGKYVIGSSANVLDSTGYYTYHGWILIVDTLGNVVDDWIYEKLAPRSSYINGLRLDPEGNIVGVGQNYASHWLIKVSQNLDTTTILDTIYDMGNMTWAVDVDVDTTGYYVITGYAGNDITLLKVVGWQPVNSTEPVVSDFFEVYRKHGRWILKLDRRADVRLFSSGGRLIFEKAGVSGVIPLPERTGLFILQVILEGKNYTKVILSGS